MNHQIRLTLRYSRKMVDLTDCISLRYEKERYTPYSTLSGRWYCRPDVTFEEIVSVMLYIDNTMIHYGFPDGIELERKDGLYMLKVSSKSYTSALLTNQCDDKMLTDVDLTALAASGPTLPVVSYERNTPKVNYVNYYDGTSCWDAIVCYAVRATGIYPYIRGYMNVCVSRAPATGSYTTVSDMLIMRSHGSDFSELVSEISESDIEGTPGAFVMTEGRASSRMMTRRRRINFDREWIMDPEKGLEFKLNRSLRKMSYDVFSFPGYAGLDLLDSFTVSDIGFIGEADRIVVTANAEKGFVTTVWCYHDGFCA